MTAGPTAPGTWDLVGVVQRFGLFSAATVVDRYVEIVDRTITRDPLAPPSDDRGSGRLVDRAVQMADAFVRLLDTSAAQLDARGPTTETLVLPETPAGLSAEASLWVHNTTPSPSPTVVLHVSGLVSPTGHTIPADAVSLRPQRIDPVAAGTSREVRLRVRVPVDQPAALYHGLVVSSASPTEPMTLRLAVP